MVFVTNLYIERMHLMFYEYANNTNRRFTHFPLVPLLPTALPGKI